MFNLKYWLAWEVSVQNMSYFIWIIDRNFYGARPKDTVFPYSLFETLVQYQLYLV